MGVSQTKPLEEIIKELPDQALNELKDYANILLKRNSSNKRKTPKFNWAGALRDLKEKYTSVELQHEISKRISEKYK